MTFDSFLAEISRYRTIGILSHVRPDADAIGSQTALAMWFRARGVTAYCMNDDFLPRNLLWLSDRFPVRRTDTQVLAECDAYVVVDGNALHRFGSAGLYVGRTNKPVFMIDHHPDPDSGFVVAVNSVEASSTCELIYRLYRESDLSLLTLEAAEALYSGMMTDTGSFRFDSVTADTHLFISEMMERTGVQAATIHRRIFDGRSVQQLQLLGDVLSTLELHANGAIATLAVTKNLLADHGCDYSDLDGMVNYGLSIAGVKAAILACEMNDGVKLSLRSVEPIDVNLWARELDGGGHVRAAGARHKGPMKKTISDVVRIGMKQL